MMLSEQFPLWCQEGAEVFLMSSGQVISILVFGLVGVPGQSRFSGGIIWTSLSKPSEVPTDRVSTTQGKVDR
jgi:alkylated DNA nucleotide flippase Atl1